MDSRPEAQAPSTDATPGSDWIDWSALERSLALDVLPDLHRALLALHRPGEDDWSTAFLRKVQGKVQATLAALEREGRARRDDAGHVWLEPHAVPDAWRHTAETSVASTENDGGSDA